MTQRSKLLRSPYLEIIIMISSVVLSYFGLIILGAVPEDAARGRALRLYRAGRRAVRLFHRAQGHPQDADRGQSTGGRRLDALRRV